MVATNQSFNFGLVLTLNAGISITLNPGLSLSQTGVSLSQTNVAASIVNNAWNEVLFEFKSRQHIDEALRLRVP